MKKKVGWGRAQLVGQLSEMNRKEGANSENGLTFFIQPLSLWTESVVNDAMAWQSRKSTSGQMKVPAN